MLRALRKEQSEVVAWGEKAARIEERVREKMRRHEPIAKNVEVMHQEQLTFGQRVSDGLAEDCRQLDVDLRLCRRPARLG